MMDLFGVYLKSVLDLTDWGADTGLTFKATSY